MKYFIYANSFAAPFFSDSDTARIEAKSVEEALTKFVKKYNHPCGLYAAACWKSADDYHDGKAALASWLCNHVLEMEKATEGKSCYSCLVNGPGDFEIDGKKYKVKNPKDGKIVGGRRKKK